MTRITDLELKVLHFIAGSDGFPTYSQFQKRFGWASPNSATQIMDQLYKKGLMYESPNGGNRLTQKAYSIMKQYRRLPVRLEIDGEEIVTDEYEFVNPQTETLKT